MSGKERKVNERIRKEGSLERKRKEMKGEEMK